MMFKFLKFKVKKEPKYKVSHEIYGDGYVVHTNTKHVEYFNTRQEANKLRDKLNKEEE